jgi:hypothetical protein
MRDLSRTVDFSDRSPAVDDVVTVDPRHLRQEYRAIRTWHVRDVETIGRRVTRVRVESPSGRLSAWVFPSACERQRAGREERAALLW